MLRSFVRHVAVPASILVLTGFTPPHVAHADATLDDTLGLLRDARSTDSGDLAGALAARFADLGVHPLPLVDGSSGHIHEFDAVSGYTLGKDNELTLTIDGTSHTLEVGKEWRPLPGQAGITASGDAAWMAAESIGRVFNRKRSYLNEFEGRMLIEPALGHTAFREGWYAGEVGAKALLMFDLPGDPQTTPELPLPSVPVALVNEKALIARLGASFPKDAEVLRRTKAGPRLLDGVQVTLRVDSQPDTRSLRLVAGIVDGSDPERQSETVIVAAPFSDSADNAIDSASAALVALAASFQANASLLGRSALFVLYPAGLEAAALSALESIAPDAVERVQSVTIIERLGTTDGSALHVRASGQGSIRAQISGATARSGVATLIDTGLARGPLEYSVCRADTRLIRVRDVRGPSTSPSGDVDDSEVRVPVLDQQCAALSVLIGSLARGGE